jgi:geranylgeranyl pyrophosphate synthase/predicted secreted hydrolase
MRADWPEAGPIDLALHDLPHGSSTTEWWYVNAHLELAGSRHVSLFAAFFRVANGRDPATGEPQSAHFATWALSDADGKAYHAESRVDPAAPRIGLARIRQGHASRDPRLNRAMTELLERGVVPAPDRVFTAAVRVARDRLDLDFGGLRFARLDGGGYRLQLDNPAAGAGCDLTLTPAKPAIRHGDDGLVRGPGGEEMFYYFIPRCGVTGAVTLGGEARPVASGSGWYDHEFGGPAAGADDKVFDSGGEVAWNWLAAQLDDGSEVSAYTLVRAGDGKVLHQRAVVIDPDGARTAHQELSFTPLRSFRSVRTFRDYPTAWSLSTADLSLRIEAAFDDQELITCISKPAFWEGRCAISGTLRGKQVAGLGYVERSGFESIHDLDQFFSAVGEEVRKSVAATLPLDPTAADAQRIAASADRPHYLEGVDSAQLSRALIRPIREIVDRGGKAWRSYAALACCEVVKGDSRRFVRWLAMPELLHVGSLIVDDVEDRSTVRRGGPACHVIHGEPLAINAGTAAYFLTQGLLVPCDMPDARKLRLYDLYFEAMRAGHAGQALDLDGPSGLVPAAIETGDSAALEKRILATHRLKTAAPAASLARMGAVAGGGSDAQVEVVGNFFEALGLAFQIVDDVLNLRGFKGDLKARAEDLSKGTITLPFAKALPRLAPERRRWLWKMLQARTEDPVCLSEMVETIETCGALKACADEATALVEAAWKKADPCLEDSLTKVVLRAFGWYVLERHY